MYLVLTRVSPRIETRKRGTAHLERPASPQFWRMLPEAKLRVLGTAEPVIVVPVRWPSEPLLDVPGNCCSKTHPEA